MKSFEKIRLMREINQFSQQDIADKLNMSINGYSKIERGETRLTVERMKQIADIFQINIQELLQDDELPCVLIIGENNQNNGHNIQIHHADFMEHKIELETLKQLVAHQREMLIQKDKELAALEEIIALLKK